ncbi:MAG TPA: hypothetical protein VFY63_13730 [Pseudorhizobium sp.]|nr:hypothetical protein [Pseudorhizobium sp.]
MSTAKKQKIETEQRSSVALKQAGVLALDPNDTQVRQRIADEVAKLDPEKEREILEWMEEVMDTTGWSPQE